MLEVKDVVKKFRRRTVLDGISFCMDRGTYGLLGANGAGKTTLIRCITGLYRPDSGTVSWNGEDTGRPGKFQDSLGYLPQRLDALKDLKVREYLRYFAELKGVDPVLAKKEIPEMLALLGLEEKAGSRVCSLSGGMIRRLGIGQALMGRPEILIFDEPTAGLDPEERLRFKNIIAGLPEDTITLISTHIVSDIEALCDKVIVMEKGRVKGVFSQEELCRQAEGKVYDIAAGQMGDILGSYRLVREYRDDSGGRIRFLSGEPQRWKPETPALEDGYLWMVSERSTT
ncbi:MAG TPA: ATP-binding cassette domain-containing protein [Candidatus Fimousia stercorigallinarum]|nr:ATP-binding cassette domain-containing protein [Candidatus Fimousia stercorigallinarum]